MEPKVKIALNGEFSASELEEIIRDLATARAATQPAVPLEPPSQGDLETHILVQEEALFAIRTLAVGGLRVWLRSEGIGWMAFTLTPDNRKALSEFLGKEIGHSHRAH